MILKKKIIQKVNVSEKYNIFNNNKVESGSTAAY